MSRFSGRLPARAVAAALVLLGGTAAAQGVCEAQSPSALTPVIELYTSEGCSSCPPADKWASTLKGKNAVVQAFHVGYWDYIGWTDRFAAPAYTTRQRQVAAQNGLRNIYTPQVVRNGQDWRDWSGALAGNEPARAKLSLKRLPADAQGDQFEAMVIPLEGAPANWAAYWTVTENGHASRVKSGENAGEFLKHDFVVRQYTPVGDYKGPARLTLRAVAANPAHPRQVNLVVFDPKSGKPLQALSLPC
ncbi:MAG: DUF1223 domain-containing protein [Pseudomonadota bacterium]